MMFVYLSNLLYDVSSSPYKIYLCSVFMVNIDESQFDMTC